MQQFLGTILLALVPILALVWLLGLPSAWRGHVALSAFASLGLVVWVLLGLLYLEAYPYAGANYGAMGLGLLGPVVSVVGAIGLALAFIVGLLGRFARNSKEN